ncbi:MAG: type II toxin-antitoxin system prevent-host-death family antitoxin [Chloroflexota bacterium]
MNTIWQIQEAKNKFSEVIDRALEQGPQFITRWGKNTAVVISYSEYNKMRVSESKLSEFFRASPLADIKLERDHSLPRSEADL